MKLKPGVRIHGICAEIAFVMPIIESVYYEYGTEAVVTSGIEGTHKEHSKHYIGHAIDLRTRTVDTEHHMPLVISLKEALGTDFDVILEHNHIHVEFDPPNPYK